MTVVQSQCSESEARRLTERIVASVTDTFALITEAYERRAWVALGYSSWGNYVGAEFAGRTLPRSMILALRQFGMSTRGIGVVTGVSDITVRRELSTASNDAVLPERIIGEDGRSRPAAIPPRRSSVIEGADDICKEFIQALRNMVALSENVPFSKVTAAARLARIDELRAVQKELDQIITHLEGNP